MREGDIQKMINPRVKNKYNIKPKDIEKMIVLDKDRLRKKPFWRNNVISAWCLSDEGIVGFRKE